MTTELYEPLDPFPPGSIGELLLERQGGWLIGLEVASRRRARIVRIVLEPKLRDSGDGAWWWSGYGLQLELDVDGRSLVETESYSENVHDTFCIPLAHDAADRVRTALTAWLDSGRDDLDLDRVLAQLIPSVDGAGMRGWLQERGLSLLNDDTGAMASARRGERTLTITADELALETGSFRRFGSLAITFSIRTEEHGDVVDLVRQPLLAGCSFEALTAAAPSQDDPALADLCSRWRAAVNEALLSVVDVDGLLPHDFSLDLTTPLTCALRWAIEGPPGPRPRRIHWTACEVERASSRCQLLAAAERARITNADVAWALRLDGRHVLCFCPGQGDDLGFDRILLQRDGAPPTLVLRTDDEIQNQLKFTIDGDAEAYRDLAQFVRAVLDAAGIDPRLPTETHEDEDESDADGDDAIRLRDWLLFRYRLDEPVWDWRRPADAVVDIPYWKRSAFLPAPPAGEVDRIRREDLPAYYAFIREVLDPTFEGRLE